MADSLPVTVTVILPTRNEEEALGPTIDAIPRGWCKDLEIMIVDGNSSDKTREIALEKNIRVHLEPRRRAHLLRERRGPPLLEQPGPARRRRRPDVLAADAVHELRGLPLRVALRALRVWVSRRAVGFYGARSELEAGSGAVALERSPRKGPGVAAGISVRAAIARTARAALGLLAALTSGLLACA